MKIEIDIYAFKQLARRKEPKTQTVMVNDVRLELRFDNEFYFLDISRVERMVSKAALASIVDAFNIPAQSEFEKMTFKNPKGKGYFVFWCMADEPKMKDSKK